MKETDPRSKNTWFDGTSPTSYLHQYAAAVKDAVLIGEETAEADLMRPLISFLTKTLAESSTLVIAP